MSCAPPEGSSAGSRGNCFAPGRTAYCSAVQQQASSPPGNRRRKEKHETHISPGQTKPSLETEGTRKFRCSGKVITSPLFLIWASLMAQVVKNLSAMTETWVRSLGWEDPLEKGKAIHSSTLAWRIPWTV